MLDSSLADAIRARLRASEFARWMGFEPGELGDGTSEIRLRVQPHHLNPGGIVHGGVIATMLDAAIGIALRTRLGMGSNHVTVNLSVSYVRAVRGGAELIARGRALHSGGRVGHGEADLLDPGGRLLARASATFLVVPDPTPET